MSDFQDIAKKFQVTEVQVKSLKEGMEITWDQISYDCYEFADMYNSETEMVAEMTIDAGRIQEHTRIRGMLDDYAWLDDVRKNGLSVMKLGQETWDAQR